MTTTTTWLSNAQCPRLIRAALAASRGEGGQRLTVTHDRITAWCAGADVLKGVSEFTKKRPLPAPCPVVCSLRWQLSFTSRWRRLACSCESTRYPRASFGWCVFTISSGSAARRLFASEALHRSSAPEWSPRRDPYVEPGAANSEKLLAAAAAAACALPDARAGAERTLGMAHLHPSCRPFTPARSS